MTPRLEEILNEAEFVLAVAHDTPQVLKNRHDWLPSADVPAVLTQLVEALSTPVLIALLGLTMGTIQRRSLEQLGVK